MDGSSPSAGQRESHHPGQLRPFVARPHAGEDFACTAIFAIHYRQTIEAVQALIRIGINVPGDISVIPIGHSRGIDFFQPRLTSLVIDYDHDADVIADRMAAVIKQRNGIPDGCRRIAVLEGKSVISLKI